MSFTQFSSDGLEILVPNYGYCLVSVRITVDRQPVRYMYREEPDSEDDSGWRFLAGDEDAAYLNDPNNLGIYDVNTIANYDRNILPWLEQEIGQHLLRNQSGFFILSEEVIGHA